jgi:hypothetical protein
LILTKVTVAGIAKHITEDSVLTVVDSDGDGNATGHSYKIHLVDSKLKILQDLNAPIDVQLKCSK